MKPMPTHHPIRRHSIAALLAALALSACAAAPVAPTAPPAPVQSAVPAPSPYRSVLTSLEPATNNSSPAPVVSAVPDAPSYSGAIDGRTGLRQSAVVAVSGDAASGYTMLYRPANTEPASVDAAAGKLCGSSGVASSRKNTPGSGSAMPGVQIMIVKCNAA